MSEVGISKTMFAVGLVIAVLVSSVLSTVVSMQWVMIQGPKGDKGDAGSQGEQGLTGLQGIQGLQGVQGLNGSQGPQGEQGIQGPPGSSIIFASRTKSDQISTTETVQYIDMSDMSVTLSLTNSSDIFILVSVEALPDWDERIWIQTLVGEEVAEPGNIWLTPVIFGSDPESYFVGWGAYTFNFYKSAVSPGTYTIKVQWKVSGGIGDIADRTLAVMALPIA